MAPVRLSFSVNGKEKEVINAPDDNMAVLKTPVGPAAAETSVSLESRSIQEFLIRMPPSLKIRHLLFNFPFCNPDIIDAREKPGKTRELSAESFYQTEEGEVGIRAEFVEQ